MSCLPSRCKYQSPALAYGEAGAGETVLLLHGSASNGAIWRPIMASLEPMYRVVAPDLSGYGKSKALPAQATYSVAAEANALNALLPCCGEAFHLVGHSFGGLVALQLALNNPIRVRTLTLVEPVFVRCLRHAEDRHAYEDFASVRDRFVRSTTADDRVTAMREFLSFWNGEDTWSALSDTAQTRILSLADKVVLDWHASFAFDPPAGSLALLANRTLLVGGDQSPPPMRQLLGALHRLMPDSTRSTVAGANHLLPLTHGAALTGLVLSQFHADSERRLR